MLTNAWEPALADGIANSDLTGLGLTPLGSADMLAIAEQLLARGEIEPARDAYHALLSLEPENMPAQVGLARCARKCGDRATSLVHFQAAARLAPNDPWRHFDAAEDLRELGRLDEAESAYQATLALAPDNLPAYIGLGACARRRNDRRASLGHFQAALALAPQDPWRLADLAEELRELDRLDEAESHYRAALEIMPENIQALLGLGACARGRGDRATALAIFQDAAATAPENGWARLELAEELRAAGELAQAQAEFRAALEIDPNAMHAFIGLARCARELGDREAALAAFQAALALAPHDPWRHVDVAAERAAIGQIDAAEAAYKTAIQLDPGNPQAQLGLGACARKRGDHAGALAIFESAASRNPADPWLRLEAAAELREAGQLDEAAASYREVLAILPENIPARLGLGLIARKRADRVAARAHFELAARQAPDQIWPLLEIAIEQREAGEIDAARQTAQAVLARQPENLYAWLSLGLTERYAGNYEAALAAFQSAHRAHPQNAEILVEMATEERRLGRLQDSLTHLAAAREHDPMNVPAVIRQAEQAMIKGEIAHALEIYQEALRGLPGELGLQLGRIEALAALGQGDEAIAGLVMLEAAHGPLPHLRAKRIFLLRQAGYYDQALRLARSATQAARDAFPLWQERLQIEILAGDAAAIAEALRKAPAATAREQSVVLRFKGLLAENNWDLPAALAAFEAAAELNPEDAALQQDIVRVKTINLDLAGARRHLRRFCDLQAQDMRMRGKSLNISQTHAGQIYDEYAADTEMAARLREALALPRAPRLAALAALIRESPGSTAAAITLLVALRQAGLLARRERGAGGIPPVLVQFWDSAELPADIEMVMRSWPSLNPGYQVQRFNEASAVSYLLAHFPPAVLSAFRRVREPAQKADIFRLARLAREGGVYADADDRCLAPLARILPEDATFVVYQEDYGTLGNNFIAAAPGHPVLARALTQGVNAINRGDTDVVWLSTGPALLTRAFAECYGAEVPPGVLVLDRRELYQAVAMHCSAGYKKTDKHWSNTTFAPRRTSKPPA